MLGTRHRDVARRRDGCEGGVVDGLVGGDDGILAPSRWWAGQLDILYGRLLGDMLRHVPLGRFMDHPVI
jgi:hypothetical protein